MAPRKTLIECFSFSRRLLYIHDSNNRTRTMLLEQDSFLEDEGNLSGLFTECLSILGFCLAERVRISRAMVSSGTLLRTPESHPVPSFHLAESC